MQGACEQEEKAWCPFRDGNSWRRPCAWEEEYGAAKRGEGCGGLLGEK